jgi:hypothetical protein
MGKPEGRLSTPRQSACINARIKAVDMNWTSHIFVVVLASFSVVVWCASNSDTILINDFKRMLMREIEIEMLYNIDFVAV